MKRWMVCLMLAAILLCAAIGCNNTKQPTAQATAAPTEQTTEAPTEAPTAEPTKEPTPEPTEEPTPEPTPEPTEEPTPTPTPEPTPTPQPPLKFASGLVVAYQRGTANLLIEKQNGMDVPDKTALEIRLEDGTVVGQGTIRSKDSSTWIGIALPGEPQPRTSLYLYMDGTPYPIDTKDIARMDNSYDKVRGNYERGDKMVAITFDCAYGDRNTEWLLDTLKEYNIHSTFFMTGEWIGTYYNWIERMIADGHELGSHSQSHPRLTDLKERDLEREIRLPMERMLKEHGYRMHMMRPPYGTSNLPANAISLYYGMEMVRWAQTSKDSNENLSWEYIYDLVTRELQPGDIIICHNDAKQLQDYLRPLLDELLSRGFTFCTVSELMGWEWDDTFADRDARIAAGETF